MFGLSGFTVRTVVFRLLQVVPSQERMGADGPVYCPLPSSVPQHISMAFYSSIMEQAARFEDVTWQVIESALSFESHGQQTLIRDAVPSKYRCDAFEEASKVVEGPTYPEPSNHTGHALVEVSHGASKASATLAFSAALHGATRSMHRILDSHHLNSSLDATLGNLEDLWRPICEQLGCDPSNYWEIFLSTHQQTMALLQTSAAATMRKEILQRAQLERRVQRFVGEHGEALRGRSLVKGGHTWTTTQWPPYVTPHSSTRVRCKDLAKVFLSMNYLSFLMNVLVVAVNARVLNRALLSTMLATLDIMLCVAGSGDPTRKVLLWRAARHMLKRGEQLYFSFSNLFFTFLFFPTLGCGVHVFTCFYCVYAAASLSSSSSSAHSTAPNSERCTSCGSRSRAVRLTCCGLADRRPSGKTKA